MNKNQLIVLWITIIVLVMYSMYPVQKADAGSSAVIKSGRVFFLSDKLAKNNDTSNGFNYCSIDVGALIAQTIIITAIGTGLIITLKDKKKDETSN